MLHGPYLKRTNVNWTDVIEMDGRCTHALILLNGFLYFLVLFIFITKIITFITIISFYFSKTSWVFVKRTIMSLRLFFFFFYITRNRCVERFNHIPVISNTSSLMFSVFIIYGHYGRTTVDKRNESTWNFEERIADFSIKIVLKAKCFYEQMRTR